MQLVRGENVVLLGEVDETLPELPPSFVRVSEVRQGETKAAPARAASLTWSPIL